MYNHLHSINAHSDICSANINSIKQNTSQTDKMETLITDRQDGDRAGNNNYSNYAMINR